MWPQHPFSTFCSTAIKGASVSSAIGGFSPSCCCCCCCFASAISCVQEVWCVAPKSTNGRNSSTSATSAGPSHEARDRAAYDDLGRLEHGQGAAAVHGSVSRLSNTHAGGRGGGARAARPALPGPPARGPVSISQRERERERSPPSLARGHPRRPGTRTQLPLPDRHHVTLSISSDRERWERLTSRTLADLIYNTKYLHQTAEHQRKPTSSFTFRQQITLLGRFCSMQLTACPLPTSSQSPRTSQSTQPRTIIKVQLNNLTLFASPIMLMEDGTLLTLPYLSVLFS